MITIDYTRSDRSPRLRHRIRADRHHQSCISGYALFRIRTVQILFTITICIRNLGTFDGLGTGVRELANKAAHQPHSYTINTFQLYFFTGSRE